MPTADVSLLIHVVEEPIEVLRYHGSELMQKHWSALMAHKDALPLEIDWDRYALLKDRLIVLLAWRSGRELVGYAVSVIVEPLHSVGRLVAQNDALYVRPDCLSTGAGLELIRKTQLLAKERGCSLMMWNAKPQSRLDALLPSLGYNVEEVVYVKELNHG